MEMDFMVHQAPLHSKTNYMKQLFFLAIAIVFLGTTIHAQEDRKPPKRPSAEERLKRVNEKLKQELQLNAKQELAVANAYKLFFSEVDKLRPAQAPPPPPPPDKEKVEPLAKKRDAAIKAALTQAQYQKYIEVEKTLRPPGPGGPKPPKQ